MYVPIKGLSDVIGIIDETVLRKIVRDNSIVTPSTEHGDYWPSHGYIGRRQERNKNCVNKAYYFHLITLIVALMYFPLL